MTTDPLKKEDQSAELHFVYNEADTLPDDIIKDSKQIKILHLSHNLFRDFEFLSNFENLEELVLDFNAASDESKFPREPLTKLSSLSLNYNKLSSLETLLDALSSFAPNLTFLSLLGNPLCPSQLAAQIDSEPESAPSEYDPRDYQNYRLRTVYKLPSLRFLDCSAVTQTERADAQRRGPLLEPKRVALDTSSLNANADSAAAPVANPAAPQTTQSSSEPTADEQEPQQRGALYGRSRYTYLGAHSEGNRFIRNSHL